MTFKRTPKPKPNYSRTKPLSEAHIQATCSAWLGLDGWRGIETDPKHLRGLGVSEPGMADRQYVRYLYDPRNTAPDSGCQCGMLEGCACAEIMWIEWKRTVKLKLEPKAVSGLRSVPTKAAINQKDWHAKERARGALTLIAGEDFPASIEGFCTWYRASGLQRKSISIPR